MTNASGIREFGIKREHEERRDGGCGVVFDPATQKYGVGLRPDGLMILFSGGVEGDEDMQEGILREVKEESGLHDFLHVEKIAEALAHYHNIPKNVNRVAHARCFLVVLNSADRVDTQLEEHEDFELHWASPEEVIENWQERNEGKHYDHWIYFLETGVARAKELGYHTSI